MFAAWLTPFAVVADADDHLITFEIDVDRDDPRGATVGVSARVRRRPPRGDEEVVAPLVGRVPRGKPVPRRYAGVSRRRGTRRDVDVEWRRSRLVGASYREH